ncbi:hypothetical protein FQN50_009904 [Emmonsiellopsis sp. PD_5]|nr:hypothetical protein FQN50_009904 [Emmonsiellopsis sp. PD_5]
MTKENQSSISFAKLDPFIYYRSVAAGVWKRAASGSALKLFELRQLVILLLLLLSTFKETNVSRWQFSPAMPAKKGKGKQAKETSNDKSALGTAADDRDPFENGCQCGCPCHSWGQERIYEPWERRPEQEPPHPWDVVAAKTKDNKTKGVQTKGKNERKKQIAQEEQETETAHDGESSLLGGPSWTGPLPGAILRQVCHDRGWEKPEYSISQVKGRFLASIILRPQNVENLSMRFDAPFSLKSRMISRAAHETCNLMAAYVLFRLYSDSDEFHLQLAPPLRRYLWQDEFAKLKAHDISEGRFELYTPDPF